MFYWFYFCIILNVTVVKQYWELRNHSQWAMVKAGPKVLASCFNHGFGKPRIERKLFHLLLIKSKIIKDNYLSRLHRIHFIICSR
jgi:hypothetical protein